MPEIDPIQAQLIEARRNQILDAATQVFAEKGFDHATIRDIAKAAGIADGTIYNYFDNKTALLLGILDRLNATSQRAADFQRAVGSDIHEWMRNYIQQRIEMLTPSGYQVFQVLFSEVLVNKELRDRYFSEIIQPTFDTATQSYKEWVANGTIKPLDAALTMRVFAASVIGLVLLRLMGDSELETRWNEIPAVVTEILLNGLLKGEVSDE
jgi:TetR/AcrR family fatty acid metabolism transcriptional regulator